MTSLFCNELKTNTSVSRTIQQVTGKHQNQPACLPHEPWVPPCEQRWVVSPVVCPAQLEQLPPAVDPVVANLEHKGPGDPLGRAQHTGNWTKDNIQFISISRQSSQYKDHLSSYRDAHYADKTDVKDYYIFIVGIPQLKPTIGEGCAHWKLAREQAPNFNI